MITTPFEQDNEVREVLYKVFEFSTPTDNVKHTEVCKSWREVASEVAKKQIVQFKIEDIQRKAAKFLELVPEKLEFYCPTYANLLKMDLKAHSIKRVYDITHSTTEKERVCIAGFFRVNPEDPNIPESRREGLAGKIFVELHYQETLNYNTIISINLWQESRYTGYPRKTVRYLPIELFNLGVSGENYTIMGEKNSGSTCFALCGRLIELELEKGAKCTRMADFNGIAEILNRKTAPTIGLAPPGRIWPNQLYIPSFSAGKYSIVDDF